MRSFFTIIAILALSVGNLFAGTDTPYTPPWADDFSTFMTKGSSLNADQRRALAQKIASQITISDTAWEREAWIVISPAGKTPNEVTQGILSNIVVSVGGNAVSSVFFLENLVDLQTDRMIPANGNEADLPLPAGLYTIDIWGESTAGDEDRGGIGGGRGYVGQIYFFVYPQTSIHSGTLYRTTKDVLSGEQFIVDLKSFGWHPADVSPSSQTIDMTTPDGSKLNLGAPVSFSSTGSWTVNSNGLWETSNGSGVTSLFDETITYIITTAYDLNVAADVGGSATGSAPDLVEGASATISAEPAEGYEFTEWVQSGPGTIVSKTAKVTTVTMGAGSTSFVAKFTKSDTLASLKLELQGDGYTDGIKTISRSRQ